MVCAGVSFLNIHDLSSSQRSQPGRNIRQDDIAACMEWCKEVCIPLSPFLPLAVLQDKTSASEDQEGRICTQTPSHTVCSCIHDIVSQHIMQVEKGKSYFVLEATSGVGQDSELWRKTPQTEKSPSSLIRSSSQPDNLSVNVASSNMFEVTKDSLYSILTKLEFQEFQSTSKDAQDVEVVLLCYFPSSILSSVDASCKQTDREEANPDKVLSCLNKSNKTKWQDVQSARILQLDQVPEPYKLCVGERVKSINYEEAVSTKCFAGDEECWSRWRKICTCRISTTMSGKKENQDLNSTAISEMPEMYMTTGAIFHRPILFATRHLTWFLFASSKVVTDAEEREKLETSSNACIDGITSSPTTSQEGENLWVFDEDSIESAWIVVRVIKDTCEILYHKSCDQGPSLQEIINEVDFD
eukprot:749501-Hanusia_phi.AAC.4